LTQAIRLELRPSRWLATSLGLLHAAGLAAALVSLSSGILVVVFVGVSISAVMTVRVALLGLPDSIIELELMPNRDVRWRRQDGMVCDATLVREGLVWAWLVVLSLESALPGKARLSTRRWIVLAPDSLDPEALRQLRVWLRARPTLVIPSDNHAA
jgi:hypothetical protein